MRPTTTIRTFLIIVLLLAVAGCGATPLTTKVKPSSTEAPNSLKTGAITTFTKRLPVGSSPGSLATGPDGNLWFINSVCPPSNSPCTSVAIGRITPSGVITLFTRGLPAGATPNELVGGPDGNLWFTYFATGTFSRGALGRITPHGTVTLFTRGLSAARHPSGLTVGTGGTLWFTASSVTTTAEAIGRIAPSGVITEFTKGLGGARPSSMVLGPGGAIWFASGGNVDHATPAIGRVTPSGVITLFTKGLIPGYSPSSIAVGPDGDLWFTDGVGAGGTGGEIGRITPSGVITLFTKGLIPGSTPWSITVGPDGNLWFTTTLARGTGGAIGRITPSGAITMFTKGLPAGSFLEGLVAGPDSNLWFTVASAGGTRGAIGRITPSGVITLFTHGLPAGSVPGKLAVGPGGDIWFTDGSAIGRIKPIFTPAATYPKLAPARLVWSNTSPVAPPPGAEVLPPEFGAPGQYSITDYLLDPAGYTILAGALGNDPSQGVIIFDYWHGLQKVYLVPGHTGAVILTMSVSEQPLATVAFRTTGGASGTVSIASGSVRLTP